MFVWVLDVGGGMGGGWVGGCLHRTRGGFGFSFMNQKEKNTTLRATILLYFISCMFYQLLHVQLHSCSST